MEHAVDAPVGFSRTRLLEWSTALVLATAGALSAWSGYQASLFEGQQARAYAEAEAVRTRASQAATLAGQQAEVDAAVFVAWTEAYARHEEALETFLRQRFRPEFKEAFDAWLALEPLVDPKAPATPFEMPDYRPQRLRQSHALASQAESSRRSGDEANVQGDLYGRTTVVCALSLFFAGIAQQFKHLSVRAGVLALACALVALGVRILLSLPRALPG